MVPRTSQRLLTYSTTVLKIRQRQPHIMRSRYKNGRIQGLMIFQLSVRENFVVGITCVTATVSGFEGSLSSLDGLCVRLLYP